MQSLANVTGANAVLAEFGGNWPSFHDAEVLRFSLDRTEEFDAVATLRVHVRRYETRGEGTVEYHQALVQSVFIEFRFIDLEDLAVSDFNGQNVIDDISLNFGRDGEAVTVQVPGIYGFDGSWRCRRVEVVSVTRGAV